MTKKLFICLLCVFVIIVLSGCNGLDELNTTETEITTTLAHQIEFTTTQPTTINVDEVQLSFPDEYIIDRGNDHEMAFERQFKMGFYSLSGFFLRLDPEVDEWLREFSTIYELSEPLVFSLIKHFETSFEDFYRAAQMEYVHFQNMGWTGGHEGMMRPNPYLLFTFNLGRINDFYSLDPARHRSARMWLEEWLQTNEPYASYSAFRTANQQ